MPMASGTVAPAKNTMHIVEDIPQCGTISLVTEGDHVHHRQQKFEEDQVLIGARPNRAEATLRSDSESCW